MSSTIRIVHTGITDECIHCGRIIEFAERDHVFAWRHLDGDTHDADPERLSLRVITERFLEEQALEEQALEANEDQRVQDEMRR